MHKNWLQLLKQMEQLYRLHVLVAMASIHKMHFEISTGRRDGNFLFLGHYTM